MKKVLKVLLIVILVIIAVLAGFLAWLTIVEHKPEAVEPAEVIAEKESAGKIELGRKMDVISWNIGYGGLGKGEDCFMDGGTEVRVEDKAVVDDYLAGIREYVEQADPDLLMLQETDLGSARSFDINEAEMLSKDNAVFGANFRVKFVPYPLPPIGRVDSGVFTTTDYQIESAERVSLPVPFSWPTRTANLKRCLLVSYLPIENSDKKLVLVNLHLEAYDDGEGKIQQTKMLRDFIEKEYEKGNYVIAGGDFNQTFPGTMEKYPIVHDDYWVPGVLEDSFLPDGWKFTYDTTYPTCRLDNCPYVEDSPDSQHYVLDGFILSPNVKLNRVENINLHFEDSDHNPVKINVELEK